MCKKLFRMTFIAFFAAIVATSSGFAEENHQEKDRMPVGVRTAQVDANAIQREAQGKFAGEVDHSKTKTTSLLARNLYYTSHPAAYQNPIAFSLAASTIELTDGSIWRIASSDVFKAASWLPTDFVVVTINNTWFSSHAFRLINQNTGEAVQADLKDGPIAPMFGSIYTHWIEMIDYYNNIVYLEDGSFWKISSFDSNVVDEWIPGDVLIIGVNDGWLSSFSPNILINVALTSPWGPKANYAAGAASF